MSLKRTSNIKVENLFLVLATIFIFSFMLAFPINRIPDEMNHARMTWEVLHKPTNESFKWMEEVPTDAGLRPSEYKQIFSQKLDMSKEPFHFGINLKAISFIPQLLGMTLGSWISPSVGMIVYMGRIFNALAYILGVYFLIRYFKYGKTALLFISLLPIMVQQAASLSYDVMNYLEIMLAIGFITNLAYSKKFTNKHLGQVAVIAILLLATKPNNFLLLGLIPFIPFEFEGWLSFLNKSMRAIKSFVARYKYAFYLLAVMALVVILQLLMRNQGGLLHYGQVLLSTLVNQNTNEHLNTILTIGMFGYFGNFTIQLPLWLIFIDIVVLTLVLVASREGFFSKEYAFISVVVFGLQVLATVTVMYLQWTPLVLGNGADISVGSQGRYFTPFLILFLPLLANIARFEISQKKIVSIVTWTLVANFLVSLYLIIPYYWILVG